MAGKVRKLVGMGLALARRPGDVPRYVRQRLGDPEWAFDVELPWFSYSAIEFLEQRLTGAETVHEYGGGGSTLFFARRARRVVTVENNPEWYADLCQALEQRGLINAEVIHATADFGDPAGFADSAFANTLPDEPVDVILIDSYDYTTHELRPLLFPKAERRILPGGMIVVDDAWRYPQLRVQNSAKAVVTKSGVGPGRRATTTTDFYLY